MIFNRRTLLHGMGAAIGAAWVMPRLAQAQGQDTRILRIAAQNDFQSLDPAFSSTVAESDIQDSLFVRLISYDGTSWNTQLDGAAEIEQVDPTHIRFALRPGIAWTNGFGEVRKTSNTPSSVSPILKTSHPGKATGSFSIASM
jgi:peptide/nickel transport system substrate-binding protein